MRRSSTRGKLNCRNLLLALLLGLAGCAPQGLPDNPVERRLGWFGVLGGDDIRAGCASGAPERYRFVYNAIYGEQVRAYDLTIGTDGYGALESTVLAGGVSIGTATLDDLANLWGGARDRQMLSPADAGVLRRAILASGLTAPPPVGLRLRSDAFYWVAAGCISGQFHFTGFQHPSPRFAAMQFPVELFRLDRSGIPVNPPRPLDLGPFEPNSRFDSGVRRGTGPRFEVQVGRNGLIR